MKISKTELPGVILIEPDVFGDDRGFFLETWNRGRYRDVGIQDEFVQDNLSLSRRGVLRGLHFQNPHAQGKLVQVLQGEVWDVAVDIRLGSPNFKRWTAVYLSADTKRQFYIPPGFGHGFVVLSDTALFAYKCTDYYHAQSECSIRWDDPELAIDWPIEQPTLSSKDEGGYFLNTIPHEKLPRYEDFTDWP